MIHNPWDWDEQIRHGSCSYKYSLFVFNILAAKPKKIQKLEISAAQQLTATFCWETSGALPHRWPVSVFASLGADPKQPHLGLVATESQLLDQFEHDRLQYLDFLASEFVFFGVDIWAVWELPWISELIAPTEASLGLWCACTEQGVLLEYDVNVDFHFCKAVESGELAPNP